MYNYEDNTVTLCLLDGINHEGAQECLILEINDNKKLPDNHNIVGSISF